MDKLLNRYFIINDNYERGLLSRIVGGMGQDICALYESVRRNNTDKRDSIVTKTNPILNQVTAYVQDIGDTNTGKILLFVTSLPSIARDICNNIEESQNNINAMQSLTARNYVDEYVKTLFMAGYDSIYKDRDKKQALYFRCIRTSGRDNR